MKDYLGEMIDLTGDSYLNPVPAVYNNGTHPRSVGQITSISVHHDASHRPHDYDSVARYHSEAANHYVELGPGLQYHYKIDNVGQIFKIRPWETWLYVVGSSENVTTLAICLDGYLHNDNTNQGQDPTREQYEALGQLLVELCENHPEFPATYPDVRPHLDFSATACCGNRFAPWVLAIQGKVNVLDIPASATYDWPEYQPSAPAPAPSPTPAPVPTPPTVVINYRVKDSSGKQIGAYTVDKNAWAKYHDNPGSHIFDQNGNDVTDNLKAKFDTPVPDPTPAEQGHDYTEQLNRIEAILNWIKDFLARIFK